MLLSESRFNMTDVRGFLPRQYWNRERVEDYDKNSSIRKTQQMLTRRAIEIMNPGKGNSVLDIGCGTGFSMEVLKSEGLKPVGVDVSLPMLEISKTRAFKVMAGDMKNLPIKSESFDNFVSISTLQWISGTSRDEVLGNYKKVAEELFRILKPEGRGVIQFFPEAKGEFEEVAKEFKSVGLGGGTVIDKEESPQKADRKFLLLVKP